MPRRGSGNRSAKDGPRAGTVCESRNRPPQGLPAGTLLAPNVRKAHTGHSHRWRHLHGSYSLRISVGRRPARSGPRPAPQRMRGGCAFPSIREQHQMTRCRGNLRTRRRLAANRATNRCSTTRVASTRATHFARHFSVEALSGVAAGANEAGISASRSREPSPPTLLALPGPQRVLPAAGTAARRLFLCGGRSLPRPAVAASRIRFGAGGDVVSRASRRRLGRQSS